MAGPGKHLPHTQPNPRLNPIPVPRQRRQDPSARPLHRISPPGAGYGKRSEEPSAHKSDSRRGRDRSRTGVGAPEGAQHVSSLSDPTAALPAVYTPNGDAQTAE